MLSDFNEEPLKGHAEHFLSLFQTLHRFEQVIDGLNQRHHIYVLRP